jgi:hypothetical protein
MHPNKSASCISAKSLKTTPFSHDYFSSRIKAVEVNVPIVVGATFFHDMPAQARYFPLIANRRIMMYV